MKPILIIGAGDYGREVAWVIHDLNQRRPDWELIGFMDSIAVDKTSHCGLPVWHAYEEIQHIQEVIFFACGIGKPAFRAKECEHAEHHGFRPATLVHPSVVMAPGVIIGPGSVIGAATVLGPGAVVGRHCAVNVQTTLGHDSDTGEFSVISPGARISGHVQLADRVFIGANAVVYQGVRIGAGATVGAASFLTKDLAAGQSAAGVPARAFLPAPPPSMKNQVECPIAAN